MCVERKIMMMFISKNMASFNASLAASSITFNRSLHDVLLQEARVVSSMVGGEFTDIVSVDTQSSIMDAYNQMYDVKETVTIQEAIALCNDDIIFALDEACHITFEQDDEIVQMVYPLKCEKKISEVIRLIDLLQTNYAVLKLCIKDVCEQSNAMSSTKFDFSCAEFTLNNASLFEAWLCSLKAKNINKNKSKVMSWCSTLIADKNMLDDVFAQNDQLTLH